MIVAASAPGKIVLLGEYAVLEGGPAIAMAVDRRAEVRLQTDTDELFTINAPGIIDRPAHFRILGDGTLDWSEVSTGFIDRLRPVAQVLRSLARLKMLDRRTWPAFSATLMTPRFYQPGSQVKLGLGSSAALVVALGSALLTFVGLSPDALGRSRWFRSLLAAHRRMQGNEGSGIDVAASLYGGVLSYRIPTLRRTPEIDAVQLPESLHYVFLWTGHSASTRDFLRDFKTWRRKHADDARQLLTDMSEISRSGIAALHARNTAELCTAASAYGDALNTLGAFSGLDIYSLKHQQLARIVHSAGAVYKPCGAGGGDFGVALSDNPEIIDRVRAATAAAGFVPLQLQVDLRGASTNVE